MLTFIYNAHCNKSVFVNVIMHACWWARRVVLGVLYPWSFDLYLAAVYLLLLWWLSLAVSRFEIKSVLWSNQYSTEIDSHLFNVMRFIHEPLARMIGATPSHVLTLINWLIDWFWNGFYLHLCHKWRLCWWVFEVVKEIPSSYPVLSILIFWQNIAYLFIYLFILFVYLFFIIFTYLIYFL